jgi:arylsulfatase A-like enzyme
VHWPNGIKAKGELRHQFSHVIDVAPTVLAAAGIVQPIQVNGCGPQGVHARLARDRDDRDADQTGAPACDDKRGFRPGMAGG